MKKISLFLISTLFAVGAFAAPCDVFLAYGQPKPSFDAQVLCRTSYLQLHNNQQKTGGLAAELLTPSTVGSGKEPRTNNFRADIEVPRSARATPKDYTGSGFDQGHIAAAGDMKEDGVSMSQSFFMSNMAPQYPKHNRGIWRGLELRVRSWVVQDQRNLYVLTGTIFTDKPIQTIGNGVGVPGAFYKLIIDKDNMDAIAFVIPNEQCCFKKLADYRISLNDLQRLIGYDLIPAADPASRAKLLAADGSSFSKLSGRRK